MPQARKQTTRRSQNQEKYRAELTSSQLVIGVCILMLFGLACFLVGVLVGKFDAAPIAEQTAAAEPPVQARTVRLAPPEPEPVPEPVEVPELPEPGPDPAPIETESPAAQEHVDAPIAEEPRVISLPEQEPVDEPAQQSEAEAPVESDEPEQEPAPTPEPEVQETAPDERTEVPPTPLAEDDVSATSAEVDVLEPELESVSAAQSDRPAPPTERPPGQFTVQIGAFSQQANAELAKKRIEERTQYRVFLVDTPSGSLVKVHVGVFASEAEAATAKRELGEKLGYDESIITKHSIAFTQAPN